MMCEECRSHVFALHVRSRMHSNVDDAREPCKLIVLPCTLLVEGGMIRGDCRLMGLLHARVGKERAWDLQRGPPKGRMRGDCRLMVLPCTLEAQGI